MTVFELGAIGEFVSSIVVLFTLVYLAIQVRQNTAQQRYDAKVTIQQGQNDVLSRMEVGSAARALSMMSTESPSVQDRATAVIWFIQYLNHFQIVFEAHANQLLEQEQYELWEGIAVAITSIPGIRDWWENENGRMAFMPDVRNLIDTNMNDESIPPQPLTDMWSFYSADEWNSLP